MANKKKLEVIREFGLTNLALNNKTSVFILTLLLTLSGIYSYITMPKESFPEIVIPTIYVGTNYPGNSPADIENLVTRPLEKEIQSINGIKNITSNSLQDYSSVIVEFNPDVDIPKALQDVKDAVDKARNDLPGDLPEDPKVMDINFSDFPIMNINISGDYAHPKLKEYAVYLQEEIEQLNEINKVDITGALEREMSIIADLHKMQAVEVTFQDIENAVKAENISLSAGSILNKGFRRSLRITAEFKSAGEIGNIIVKNEQNDIVYLNEVAKVKYGFEQRQGYARANKLPVVSLQVVKRSGENLLRAARKINNIIERVKKERFPDDLQVGITNDNSRYTRNQVNNLENSIVTGILLVTLTLLFFMGMRNALFVGIAIPLSMFIAFMLLNSSGVTLNLIVLFSLILALGLLVDNGIVVVENIYRLMQEGYAPLRAAKEGAGEVALPIISSTGTTLAAFIPLVFWESIVGEFMKYLPITLIIVLASSLFVAIVINPVLTSTFMKVKKPGEKGNRPGVLKVAGTLIIIAVILYIFKINIAGGLLLVFALITLLNHFVLGPSSDWFQLSFLPKLESAYEKTVTFALTGKNPFLFFFGTLFLLITFTILLFFRPPQILFFPDNQPDNVFVYTETPVGSDLDYTDSIAREVEDVVFKTLKPYRDIVESVITNVGEGANNPQEGFTETASPHKSRTTIAFEEYKYREGSSSSARIMEKIRKAVKKVPGAVITVEKNRMGPPVGKPINIEVSGENFEKLIDLSKSVKDKIDQAGIPGIEELKIDLETQKPQLLVHIDRDQAKRFGLSTRRIAFELRTALFGKDISKFKVGEDDHDIRLHLADKYRYNLPALLNQKITFREQSTGKIRQVPVSAVTDVEYATTYGAIKRIDLDRVITIYSNVKEGYNSNEIIAKIKRLLRNYPLPEGYHIQFTGEQEEQAKSEEFLITALMISVFTIFLILVSQFNSMIKPFIIIGSVIFSTIGVLLGLIIFKMDFVIIMTGIGIISLAGIVVNNAIVLIDYTDLVRLRKKKELGLKDEERLPHDEFIQTVITGGKIRLRPVLLTAITTILGLIPLAIGLNINYQNLLTHFNPQIYFGGNNALFWGPMAWTVVFGLTFATFLTLVIVPVMYVITDKISYYFYRKNQQ